MDAIINAIEKLGVPAVTAGIMIWLYLSALKASKHDKKKHRHERKGWRRSIERSNRATVHALNELSHAIRESNLTTREKDLDKQKTMHIGQKSDVKDPSSKKKD